MQTQWAEVIMVRSTVSNAKILASTLKELIRDVDREGRSGRIRIYQRERIDTDFCIVLIHDEEKQTSGHSQMGVRLAAALKERGQVHHTVWIAMDNTATDSHHEVISP